MRDIDWKLIRWFKKNEAWGDTEVLKFELVQRLDWFREFVGKPVVIHCAADKSGHVVNSYHYQGRAADLHVEGISLSDMFLAALRIGFTGVGLYPYWNNPGIHVDVRGIPGGHPVATWASWRKSKYVPADANEISMCHCRALRNQCLLLRSDDAPKSEMV